MTGRSGGRRGTTCWAGGEADRGQGGVCRLEGRDEARLSSARGERRVLASMRGWKKRKKG